MHDDVYRRKIDDNVAVLAVKLRASSLFKLDLSIVTGMIAAITTFLIVVIQFEWSEEQQVMDVDGPTAPPAIADARGTMQIHSPQMTTATVWGSQNHHHHKHEKVEWLPSLHIVVVAVFELLMSSSTIRD